MRRTGVMSMLSLMVGSSGHFEPYQPKQPVKLRHVSRETLNLTPKGRRIIENGGDLGVALAVGSKRDERRARHKARMRLRKRRGWR